MSPLSTSLALSSLFLGALSVPLQDSRSFPRSLRGGIVNIATRRGMKAVSPVGDNGEYVFDPTYPQQEIQRVLSKYMAAEHLIHNIHLPIKLPDFDSYPVPQDVLSALDSAYSGKAAAGVASNGQAQMPLTDYRSGNLDVLYYGPIQMGSGQQRLTFDVDTGSADLWVPVDCDDCPHPGYNTQSSSTYKSSQMPFSVTYGSGSVSGTLAQDRVAIGSLVVDNQYFGAVSDESEDFQDSPNDGLIGMAFSTIASSKKPTFFENLLNEGKVAAPIFSVYLTRGQARGSEVCLGCFDSSKARGAVSWVPVTSKTYWAVSMPGVFVNGNPIDMETDVTAAIDTGTTLIYFPQAVAQAFYRQIPGAQPADQYGEGFYTYPCNAKLNISFQFGGNVYALNTKDFNLGRTGNGSPTCVGGILALGTSFPSDLAIIGDEFLKSWYSVYDYSHGARVGFAQSINN